MIVPLVHTAFTVSLLTYCCVWRRGQAKRRDRNWETLITDFSADQIDLILPAENSTESLWRTIGGARGLWAIYRRISRVLEIADYAAEHSIGTSAELPSSLRSDALQIRFAILSLLVSYPLTRSTGHVSERISTSIAGYRSMLTQVSKLREACSPNPLPGLC